MTLPNPSRVVYFTIKNPIVAKRLVDRLVTSSTDSIILPFADHPGPISQEILTREFSSLTVCERDDTSRDKFQSYVKTCFPDRKVNIYPEDLFDLSFKSHCDKAQQKCSLIVREALDDDISSSKRVKFLVPLLNCRYEAGFFRNMYYQVSLRLGLCSDTLLHYYFLVSDRQFNYLKARPSENFLHYRSSTILYNTIFNIRALDTLDLRSSFGIGLKSIQKTSRSRDSSYQDVHLVSLEPRVDVIDTLGPKALLEFRFFVNQIMSKRTGLVLSFLDRWFGDCSYDLSRLGVTEKTRAGDLDKDGYLELFKYVRNKGGYCDSTFTQAASRAEDHLVEISPTIKT